MTQNNTPEAYDVIVVGSGPGGATTAKELSEKGKKVLILERGPDVMLNGTLSQYIKYQLVPFKSLLVTNQMVGMVRGIITGGSSTFYYGTCFEVPHKMFKKFDIDVSAEEREAREELPIAPLKQEMMTPMANRIMTSAQDLGYEWNPLNKFMYQDRWQPGIPFGYYGDPNYIKWSARMYVEEAEKNGADIINNAKVIRVIIENNKAIGVEYKYQGRLHKVFASDIVIAAGGIGSPVVLRKSGIQNVGRDFFFDPLISVCGVANDIKAEAEIPMSAGVHMKDDGYLMTDMSLPTAIDALFSVARGRFHRTFSQKRMLRIMIKIKDELGGEITDRELIHKRLSKADQQKLKKGETQARVILKNAGAKGIFKTAYLAAHPGGSVKIGEALDSNLKTIKYDNLYVCDCSVIPEAWGLPPTMSLICLGKRLAKYLVANR